MNKLCPFCGKEVLEIPWQTEEDEGTVVCCRGNNEEEGCEYCLDLEIFEQRPLESALQNEVQTYKLRLYTFRKVSAAAMSALRSYQYGNQSTKLAEEIADALQSVLDKC